MPDIRDTELFVKRDKDDFYPLSLTTSSKGNQQKYYSPSKKEFIKSCFYYQDRYWRDDLVEVIASSLANDFGFKLPSCEVLVQKSIVYRGRPGTHSKDFRAESEEFVPLGRALNSNSIVPLVNQGVKTFDWLVDIYSQLFKVDAFDYLFTQTLLDTLVGNEDRHLYNFGILLDTSGRFRLPPIFDFGLGMFEHDLLYEGIPPRECLDLMQFKTFGVHQISLMQNLFSQYPSTLNQLPTKIRPSAFTFPSDKAETYLRYASIQLGVTVCNS